MMPEMGELGLLGPTIPEEYGGAGMDYVAYGLIAREVERVDSGYRSAMRVQSSLVMYPIYAYGSEAQRRKYLPKLATGEFVGCFGLTEPDHGSDPGSMMTRAERCPAAFSSTAPRSGSPIRRSPTSRSSGRSSTEDPRLHRGARHQGIFHAKDRRQVSLRASITGEIVLEDALVPEDNLLPNVPASPARSAASTWRAPASPGARWAPPNSAGTAPATTRSTASSSAGRSPPTS